MIISTDAEKAFDKIQHPSMTKKKEKPLQKVGIEETYLNIKKAIYDKPIGDIMLNGEKLKAFPLRSGTGQGMSTLTTLAQHSFASPSHGRGEKEINGVQTGKQVKLSLFADDMRLYTKNPKDARRKLPELINALVKLQDAKLIHRHLCISIH